MDRDVEHELCANCKKEIPQPNYVMHTAHCARNITLCKTCNEPIPKGQYEEHKKSCAKARALPTKPAAPPTTLENSSYYQQRKSVEEQKVAARKERHLQKHERLVDTGYSLKSTSGGGATPRYQPNNPPPLPRREDPPKQNGALPRLVNPPPKSSGLLACKFCDLELPKLELEGHENYCGSRTDKCLDCGELVMYKDKQAHLDSDHGGRGARRQNHAPSAWDSQTQRDSASNLDVDYTPRRRPSPLANFDYDPLPYMPNAYIPGNRPQGIKIEKGESYKEISRRLDCKTEYIRNLLHDSASITVPIRHSGLAPRNHFYHDKGPAPQPPRRRNPPTELTVSCEFCGVPFPHEDLIDHEAICRLSRKSHITIPCSYCRTPILQEDICLHEVCCRDNQISSSFNSSYTPPTRGRKTYQTEDTRAQVTMPCEFCQAQIPEDDLILHETGCRPDLARRAPRRRRSPEPDDYFVAPPPQQPSSPEIELPCEFCADMIPASQLLRHQATCS